jgi:hypothetical protein
LLDAKAGTWPGSLTPGLPVWLTVEADAPRALLAALAEHPDVLELRYDETGAGRVLLRGSDLERLATAIGRAAVATGVEVRSLRPASEDLDAARAAATGMNEAAGVAYRAARARGRAGATPSGQSSTVGVTPATSPVSTTVSSSAGPPDPST